MASRASRSDAASKRATTPRTRSSKPTRSVASKRSGPRGQSGSKDGSREVLAVAGVEICKEGENLSEEELDRRFALAEEAMWKKLHDKGHLPLRNDTEDEKT